MCLEAMDTRKNHVKTVCLRKTMKSGSKLGWKLSRVFTEDEETLRNCRATAVKTIRKYLRREQRRGQLAKLVAVLGGIGKKEKMESVDEKSCVAACVYRQPSGAMAPRNTTQYLMGNVYEDMKTNTQTVTASHETSTHTSPGVCDALDADYESCLAFQQRDFEEVFALTW